MISQYSTVELTRDLPGGEAMAGSVAAVIEIYHTPDIAYEIEIVDDEGVTRFVGSVAPEMVKEISLGSNDERPMVVESDEERSNQ